MDTIAARGASDERTLVYLVAIGILDGRYLTAVRQCVNSLRTHGSYSGDVVVLTDAASASALEERVPSADLVVLEEDFLAAGLDGRPIVDRYRTARLRAHRVLPLSNYDTIMYLDADILAVRSIMPLFQGVDSLRVARQFEPMSNPGFSALFDDDELERARWRRGINSGTYVVPSEQLAAVLEGWWRELDGHPGGPCYDQDGLNALVLRERVLSAPLPSSSVAFPLRANFAAHFSPQTRLLHYCGNADLAFELMDEHAWQLACGVDPSELRGIEALPPSGTNPRVQRSRGVRKLTIALDDASGAESSSIANSNLASALRRRGHEVVPIPSDSGSAGVRPDVVIHHDYRRNFGDYEFVPGVPHVAIRSWDFGPFPVDWTRIASERYEQLWVHTQWGRVNAVDGGIDPARVRLIPHGVDSEVFRPDGPQAPLPTAAGFTFLFVGGPLMRKGIDLLVDSFCAAFRSDDDVALIVKANSASSVSRDQQQLAEVRRRAADPAGPEIVVLDEHLPAADLAALYRACDVGIWPYRAEGFVLPALEALACGMPTIVPEIGPTTDFSSSRTSFLVPAREVRLPVRREFELLLGHKVEVDGVRIVVPSRDALAAVLRTVRTTPKVVLHEKGAHGVAVAHGEFSWNLAAQRAESSLAELIRPLEWSPGASCSISGYPTP